MLPPRTGTRAAHARARTAPQVCRLYYILCTDARAQVNGVRGYTTYRLYVQLTPGCNNIYAILCVSRLSRSSYLCPTLAGFHLLWRRAPVVAAPCMGRVWLRCGLTRLQTVARSGVESHPMVIPPAFQTDKPFGAADRWHFEFCC